MTDKEIMNHDSPDESHKLTLQDELEMLNYEGNEFDDGDDIFGSDK